MVNLGKDSMVKYPPRGRLIAADDNIRTIGGHYYELATLLLSGAEQLGYQPVLGTHAGFDSQASVDPKWQLYPTFTTRRLVRWSIGVDGGSKYERDLTGHATGGTSLQNNWCRLTDRFCRPDRRPQSMLQHWANDLARLLKKLKPTPSDSLLINTGDDFAMLALAAAMKQAGLKQPIRVDVIFHFAVYEASQADRKARLQQFGRQLRAAVSELRPHDVHLHATTKSLTKQIHESGVPVNAIPYPTRPREIVAGSAATPLKIVLAGLPRAEKGRGAIAELLARLEQPQLRSGHFRVSMQMPSERWQAMVPRSLHAAYVRAIRGSANGPLEVMMSNLTTDAYHEWLDTADVGLFLYEPQRYVARCSGVLLEMFTRGIPVIVPDRCWLADQVRAAGGHRTVGLIYQSREEIPELLRQFLRSRDQIRARAIEHASLIANRHNGKNTLLEMGLRELAQRRQAA